MMGSESVVIVEVAFVFAFETFVGFVVAAVTAAEVEVEVCVGGGAECAGAGTVEFEGAVT